MTAEQASEREQEIQARAEAATPGPWSSNEPTGFVTDPTGQPLAIFGGGLQDCADAAFIAHARADVSVLLDEISRLRDQLDAKAGTAQYWRNRAYRAENVRWDSELPPGGEVCATCEQPVESEPCPDHSPAAELDRARAQRQELVQRLRAGQRWQRGRTPALVSEDYVSQDELRQIFKIPLTAPWEEMHVVADDSDNPEYIDPASEQDPEPRMVARGLTPKEAMFRLIAGTTSNPDTAEQFQNAADKERNVALSRCPAKHGALGRICERPAGHPGMHTGEGLAGLAVWEGSAE